uniref:SFRICE_008690 n=1 Tax=Spodoptera frugiperda TaxID=7108 RepID=A0A2H1VM48_SPOFR
MCCVQIEDVVVVVDAYAVAGLRTTSYVSCYVKCYMRVTGTHLAAACKLVFKIAKNDKNDIYFKTTNLLGNTVCLRGLELLVEGCGRAEPVSEAGCCVYGCAALRVLALEPALCARAVAAGAAHLAALHLKILNNAKAECPRSLGEQSTHALYQVTGALRSLAGAVDRCAHDFLASGALPELVSALALHTDRDVLTNVARCLSVVSGSAECCAWLCACGGAARAVLRALAACAPRAPLAVRLAYTLGNMAAADERARNDIYNEDGAIDVLLTILESYTKKNPQDMPDVEADPDLHLVGSDLGGSDGSNEDVLIKTVRVVANLCLAERVGRGLADIYAQRIVNSLLACLQLAETIITHTDKSLPENMAPVERAEELATAALATLNNLTFYREPPDPPDPLHVPIDNICKATCRWLRGSGPASCEAVRALGNVSRATRTAQLIVLEGALDRLEPFLNHEDGSVRCAAAGVLVNVCGAGAECGAAAALAARALAAAAAHRDTQPAPLLARALWNAHAHHQYPLSPIHAHAVSEALAVFIAVYTVPLFRPLSQVTPWRNGSASDSRSEGCVFKSRRDDESVFAACEADKLGEQEIDRNVTKHHVTFDLENNNYASECDPSCYDTSSKRISRKNSLETGDVTGEDLGFEEGDVEECWCDPCRRLATWDELVGVAIPLLDRLRPPRTDASVGTE